MLIIFSLFAVIFLIVYIILEYGLDILLKLLKFKDNKIISLLLWVFILLGYVSFIYSLCTM
jgi:multidrug transporter EmrE-like cation transporter